MRSIIIDAYDSFTFNLKHYAEGILDAEVPVLRLNDSRVEDIANADVVIFSPGAGLPQDSPHLLNLVRFAVERQKRILGVCLGHQALAVVHNATLENLETVHHGVSHPLVLNGESILFSGINEDFYAGRYHSWVVNEESLGSDWKITSRDIDDRVMSMEHKTHPFFGIQFHPESVLSPFGYKLLQNFFESA